MQAEAMITMDLQKVARLLQLCTANTTEGDDSELVLLDVDGTILTWNEGVQKLKGYRSEEIIGQHFRLFYLPGDRQQRLPEKLISVAMLQGRAEHVGRRLRKDGSVFLGSIVITAIHDETKQVVGFTKLTRELAPGIA